MVGSFGHRQRESTRRDLFLSLNENDNEKAEEVGASDMNSNRKETTGKNVMTTDNRVMVTEGEYVCVENSVMVTEGENVSEE